MKTLLNNIIMSDKNDSEINEGIIEYLDVEETFNSLISMSPDKLSENNFLIAKYIQV